MELKPCLRQDNEGVVSVDESFLSDLDYLQDSTQVFCVLGEPSVNHGIVQGCLYEEIEGIIRELKVFQAPPLLFFDLRQLLVTGSFDSRLSLPVLALTNMVLFFLPNIDYVSHMLEQCQQLFSTLSEFQDKAQRILLISLAKEISHVQIKKAVYQVWEKVRRDEVMVNFFELRVFQSDFLGNSLLSTDSLRFCMQDCSYSTHPQYAKRLLEITVQNLSQGGPISLSGLAKEAYIYCSRKSRSSKQEQAELLPNPSIEELIGVAVKNFVHAFVQQYKNRITLIDQVITAYDEFNSWTEKFKLEIQQQNFPEEHLGPAFSEAERQMSYTKAIYLKILVEYCLADLAYHRYKLRAAEINSELLGIYVFGSKLEKEEQKLHMRLSSFEYEHVINSRIYHKLRLYNSILRSKLDTTRNVSIAGGAASVALAATGIGIATWVGRAAFLASSMLSVYEGLNIAEQVGEALASLGYTAFEGASESQQVLPELESLLQIHKSESTEFILKLKKAAGAKLMREIDREIVENGGLVLTKYDLEKPLLNT